MMDVQQVQNMKDVPEGKLSDTIIDHLPHRWKLTKLSNQELFTFENGLWTGKKEPIIDYPVIRNTNFSNDGSLNLSNVAVIPIEQRQLERKRLKWGDIIIERSGGGPQQPVGRVVFFNLTEGNYCFSNFTTRLRVIDKVNVDPRYLHLFLLYFHNSGQTEKLQNRTTGIRNLAFEDYKNSLIPLPPPSEQHAIVKVLQTVQEAIQTRQDELKLEHEHKAALMEYLFTYGTRGETTKQTEIGEIPESWQVAKLGDKCNVSTGTTPSTDRPEYYQGTIPFIKTSEIVNNRIMKAETYISEQARQDYNLKVYPPGTIFIAMYGQGKTRGQVALLDISATTTQNTGAIVPNEELSPEFLWQWLMGQYNNLREAGSIGHISHLNLGYVKQYKILLPNHSEQKEIAAILQVSMIK